MEHRQIRVMQITHDLAIGGLQRVVATLCHTIDPSLFQVSVLCLRGLGPFANDIAQRGTKVQIVRQTKGSDYLCFLKVAQALRAAEIEVIHTHNTQPFLDGTMAALLSRVRTIVHTDHAREFPDKWRYMKAERILSHFAYRVVGVSEHTSANLHRYEKIPRTKIETIPNGIDPSPFEGSIDRAAKLRELGIPEGVSVIGIAARLTPQKGITYLLKALPEIIRRFPKTVLVIAGEGPLELELRAEAERLAIAPNVLFVGRRLDMPHLLRSFDLYVMPSLWEGLPMVLLEAMAAGCPIVATDVGGVATAVEHGVNGILVPPRDPRSLASAIVRLLEDPLRREHFAREGKRMFHSRFTADIMTRRYEQLYQRRAS
jgi:glycosyltransferase involved in cell wall biosynthesis